MARALRSSKGFQSTPPARGATLEEFQAKTKDIFQSTPPARGATPRPLMALL